MFIKQIVQTCYSKKCNNQNFSFMKNRWNIIWLNELIKIKAQFSLIPRAIDLKFIFQTNTFTITKICTNIFNISIK